MPARLSIIASALLLSVSLTGGALAQTQNGSGTPTPDEHDTRTNAAKGKNSHITEPDTRSSAGTNATGAVKRGPASTTASDAEGAPGEKTGPAPKQN